MEYIMIIVAIWFLVLGAYSLYFANSMKRTGTIKAGWLVSKNIQLTEGQDVSGYIAYTYPRTIGFACVVIAAALLLLIGEVVSIYLITVLGIFCLIVTYIWYLVITTKAEKQYLSGR